MPSYLSLCINNDNSYIFKHEIKNCSIREACIFSSYNLFYGYEGIVNPDESDISIKKAVF
jgi:hypothetical protein